MSIRTERCPTCKGSGLIKVDDWLIKGKTEEELAREKKEALADIVEVVRCKDCKYSEVDENDNLWCAFYNEKIREMPTGYCWHGERKETDGRS